MTTDFAIHGPSRVCAASGTELQPGDAFMGVLLDEAGKFVRQDYSVKSWQGPPSHAIAYWAGRVPKSNKPVKPVINDQLLLDCFDHLAQSTEPERLQFRYVLALLLMRRKRLKFEDIEKQTDGRDYLLLRDSRTGNRLQILDPRLSESEMATVQDQVFQVLGWE